MPATEFENAKKNSKFDSVINLSDELQKLTVHKKYPYLKSSVLIDFFIENKIKDVIVPESFPIIEAENLKNQSINLTIKKEPFFDERITKSDEEINFIKNTTELNTKVMKEVHDILASSRVNDQNMLLYQNEILTSEFFQNHILKSFIDKELFSDSVIVAVGNQGCLPHEHGWGSIYAGTSIIVDIFPNNRINHYYTDMTRTFCKGKAPDDLKKIYNAVKEAQKIGLDNIKADCKAKLIHNKIQEYFINKGFKTGVINGMLQGFFHSTGHGVGLDCHELPFISPNGDVLPLNSVVTVEPGLYYHDLGAARIEDIVVVKKDTIENLTDFHKNLEIE